MADNGTSSATSGAGLSSWDTRPSMARAGRAATLGWMARYRPGIPDETRACFEIFEAAVDDLGRRTGGNADSTAGDPAAFDIRRPA